MNDTSPFVIQFPSLDDFIAEMAVADIGLARVWLGQFGTGGSPGTRYHAVMVQAIDAPQHTILQTTLIIGSYQTLYDTPFGPTNEAAARIIQERQKQALSDVQAYLVGKLSAIALRPGHIHTGLDGTKISRTYWDGFNPIYEELKQARKGDR